MGVILMSKDSRNGWLVDMVKKNINITDHYKVKKIFGSTWLYNLLEKQTERSENFRVAVNSNKGKRILNIFCLTMAICLFIFGLYTTFKSLNLIFYSEKTQGLIVDLKYSEHRSKNAQGRTSYPIVKFKASDGKEYKFVSELGIGGGDYNIANKVEVLYIKNNPDEAEINSKLHLLLWPVIFILVGIGIILGIVSENLKNKTLKDPELEFLNAHEIK